VKLEIRKNYKNYFIIDATFEAILAIDRAPPNVP